MRYLLVVQGVNYHCRSLVIVYIMPKNATRPPARFSTKILLTLPVCCPTLAPTCHNAVAPYAVLAKENADADGNDFPITTFFHHDLPFCGNPLPRETTTLDSLVAPPCKEGYLPFAI